MSDNWVAGSGNVWIDLGFSPEESEKLERQSLRFITLQEGLKRHLFEKSKLMRRGFTAEEMLKVLTGTFSQFSETRVEELLKLIDE